jgi:predicted cupin superfamily sugar epimerase
MSSSAAALVRHLQLLPHPEGGYYRETYRSSGRIPGEALPAPFSGERNYSTAIYFLLEGGQYSAFHRIASDECWHFYQGIPLHIYVLHPSGELETIVLGNGPLGDDPATDDPGAGDPAGGAVFQAVVPAGCWFASRPSAPGGFCLVGCTVAPGFDFTDFEMAGAETLAREYPMHASLIRELCR